MDKKQFWKWLFQEIDNERLFTILREKKITINGFRLNSAQDIKKGNALLQNNFLLAKNNKKIQLFIETNNLTKIEETLSELQWDKLIEIANENSLLDVVLKLFYEKQSDLALSLVNHFAENEEFIEEQQSDETENKSTDTETKNTSSSNELNGLASKLKKLEEKNKSLKEDLEKKTDEIKKLKEQHKTEKKDWQQKVNEKNSIYSEQIKVYKNNEAELEKKNKALEKEKNELLKKLNNTNSENELLREKNSQIESELNVQKIKEEIEIEANKLNITLVGKPMNPKVLSNKKICFNVIESDVLSEYPFEKNTKICWILKFDLTVKQQRALIQNPLLNEIEDVEYFEDYKEFTDAIANLEKIEVRV